VKLLDIKNRTERFIRQVCGRDVWNWRQVRVETLAIGKEKYVICPNLLSSSSIVYSAGIGDDVSFEMDVIKHFGASVFCFEPSPESILWIEKYNLPVELKLFPFGVSDHDGEILLYRSDSIEDDTWSICRKKHSLEPFEATVMRISSIMKDLGHARIDLLKMNIEGSEYAVIQDLIDSEIKPDQIIIEFHHKFPQIGVSRTRQSLYLLRKAGYRIVYIDAKGHVYSFINREKVFAGTVGTVSVFSKI